jgi:hypothetical protein
MNNNRQKPGSLPMTHYPVSPFPQGIKDLWKQRLIPFDKFLSRNLAPGATLFLRAPWQFVALRA